MGYTGRSLPATLYDTYTTSEVEALDAVIQADVDTKAPQATTYTKTEVDTNIYTKTEVDAKQVGKNLIIGGDFDTNPWQRGTSFAGSLGNAYVADRWIANSSGVGDLTSRQNFTYGQTDVPNEPAHFLRMTADATVGNRVLSQRVEGVRTLAGQASTVSFWMRTSTPQTFTIAFGQNFGSGGSVTTETTYPITTTTSWQKFTFTHTFDSIAGKTIGDNNYIFVTPIRALGVSSVDFDLAQVQLEKGTVATAFEQRPYGLELSLCQRYYERMYGNNSSSIDGSVRPDTGNKFEGVLHYSVKRVAPSITVSGVWSQMDSAIDAGLTGSTAYLNSCRLFGNNVISATSVPILTSATASYISIDAEL